MSTKSAKVRAIPTRPIERAHITFPGDPAAGLHSQSFTAEVWIDPTCVGDDSFWGWLAICRHKLGAAYEEMCGDGAPRVTFDFEIDRLSADAAREPAVDLNTVVDNALTRHTENLVETITKAQQSAHTKPLQLD